MQDFVAQLEAELDRSIQHLAIAKKIREQAAIEEARWEQDIRAIKNLIARRRSDAAPVEEDSIGDKGYDIAEDPYHVSGYEEINRVEWIFAQVAKAGAAGILPTEIFKASQKAGLKMHPNYPYVGTKTLMERGRIEKIGKRYRALEKEAPKTEVS